ncbi:MMPL family transporter [Spirochaeta dissipatitropha]
MKSLRMVRFLSILLLTVLTTASAVLLGKLSFDPSFDTGAERRNSIVLVIPTENPFSLESLTKNLKLHEALEKIEVFSNLNNLFTVTDIRLADGLLQEELLIDAVSLDSDTLQESLSSSPLLRLLLLTRDGSSWIHYVEQTDYLRLQNSFDDLKRAYPDLILGGVPYWETLTQQIIDRDLKLLLLAGAVVLAAVSGLLLVNLRQSLIVWVAALVAMLMSAASFALQDIAMRSEYVTVPVLVLGLATSYSLHIRAGIIDDSWVSAIRSHGKIVLLTAGTTVLGLLSLSLSDSGNLRIIGMQASLGVAFSVLTAFLAAPLFQKSRSEHVQNHPESRAEESSVRERKTPGRRVILLILGITTISIIGIPKLQIGSDYNSIFRPGSEARESVLFIQEQAPGYQEIQLTLSHPEEYFWVYIEQYQLLGSFEGEFAEAFPGSQSYSYRNLVDETLARLDGSSTPVPARSTEEIAEALELGSRQIGRNGEIIDRNYRSTQMYLRIPIENQDYRSSQRIVAMIHDFWGSQQDVEINLQGTQIKQYQEQSRFLPDQLRSGLLFGGIVGFLILSFTRRPVQIIKVLLPPLLAILLVCAVYGLLGWRMFIFETIIFAVVAGVGVDDAILMAFLQQHRQSRITVLLTTIILCSTVAVLLFSSFFIIMRIGLMIILGLATSTTLVLALNRTQTHAEP